MLAREIPSLDKQNTKLFLVSIGTDARAREYSKETNFPLDRLFADPDTVSYTALGLKKSIKDTFFNAATPLSILARLQKDQAADLKALLPRWKPWVPPKTDQAFNQGGLFVFDGEECVMSHRDEATGAHADMEVVRHAVNKACDAAACRI